MRSVLGGHTRALWLVCAAWWELPQADHPQLVSDILDIVGNSVTVTPIELPEAGVPNAAAAAAVDNQARRR